MADKETSALSQLSEFDKALAITEDPIDLKKGSAAIEVIRELAKRSGMSLETVNRAFCERVKWDRKRGQWIAENIERGGDHGNQYEEAKSSATTLADIDTSRDESSYCQKLIKISDEQVSEYVAQCMDRDRHVPTEATKSGLLRKISAGSGDYEEPELPAGTFEVVYADPGWRYDNFNITNAAQALYTTWPTEEIAEKFGKALEKVTSNLTVLFLWAVNPMLMEALHVMSCWGFQYKTNLCWYKPTPFGKADWARSQHELLLIGTRSQTRKPAWTPPSAFACERGEHSQKPPEFRSAIERMYPSGSWLELFARKVTKGWTGYGDQL